MEQIHKNILETVIKNSPAIFHHMLSTSLT